MKMKKFFKRAIALLCTLALLAGNLIIGNGRTANASETTGTSVVETSWNGYTSENGTNIVNSSKGKINWSTNAAGIILPEYAQNKSALKLYVKVGLATEAAVAFMKKCYVEIANVTCDKQENNWYVGSTGNELAIGTNEIILNLNSAGKWPKDSEGVVLTETINWLRLYTEAKDDTVAEGDIKLYEVTLKNDEVGLTFGGNDTHLQMSQPLDSTPETIEASVKLEKEVKEYVEWTLISAGEQMNGAIENADSTINYSFSKGYSQSAVTGTVMEEGTGPAVGTTYTEVTVEKYNAETGTGGYFGITTHGKKYITIPKIDDDIKKEELKISFWLWSADGSAMPDGYINVNSHGWWGGTTQERWNISTYINPQIVRAGWNYIELDFENLSPWSGGVMDYKNIKYFCWMTTGERWTEEKVVRITDIKLSVKEEGPRILHTLIKAGGQMNGAVSKIENQYGHKQTASTGVVAAGEVGPKMGTVYTEVSVAARDSQESTGGSFGFWTQAKEYISLMDSATQEQVATIRKENLTLSFWVWTENGEKLPTGSIKINSQGWHGGGGYQELWYIGSHVNSQITQPGWNYVELDFADLSPEGSNGTFDYADIQFIGWIGNVAEWTNGGTVRITDINLIEQKNEMATETVLVTEVDEAELAENDMIFSNTNAGDASAYALYVTKEGYPALLWGTTQYTLVTSVRTGEWTHIKVTRNSNNQMEFYLNGVLTGVSDGAETDNLSTFKTAHRIAADGAGKQVFKGSIVNLAVYNNATKCMGKYVLCGDTQYIFDVFEDRSDSNNDLVYRGTRASDWTSYEKEKNEAIEVVGEDYWSLVFTQDLQNLTLGNFPQSWWTMSEWIANNVETENIQHVVGAGDTTWNNYDSQYQNAMQGFNMFTDKVSWSNISGNHEFTWEVTGDTPLNRSNTKYNNYFGVDYIQSTKAAETYAGSYDDPMELSTTENSYYRFTVNGVKWMILQLEYYPRLSVLEWAKEVATQYPTDNIILTTHSYINGTGGYCNENRAYLKQGDGDQFLGDTTGKIWDELQTCTNIKMILCGHSITSTGYIAQKNETNSEGDSVPAFMLNAQDQDLGSGAYFDNYPMGLLGIFRFSKDGTKVAVQWFSPLYENRSYSPQDDTGERNSNNISFGVSTETCTPIVKPYNSGFVAGTAPSANDVPDGYIFAGWFTNEECTSALTNEGNVDKAYAKFVDEEILSVKAQVQVVDSDSDGIYELPTDKTDIRFVTTVDSDKYQKVGFEIRVEDNETQIIESKIVYRQLYAIGQFDGTLLEYYPDKEFSPQSSYFKAFTITGIENKNGNYDKKIYVTPYWVTLDGTTVYGEQGIKTVNQGY